MLNFLKRLTLKKIFALFLLFGFLGCAFQTNIFQVGKVSATTISDLAAAWVKNAVESEDEDFNKDMTDKTVLLNGFLKIIYIILWPLLAIAGASLDNSLVYGSVFHLDAPLWKFWNIMKNFANFALWFLVLFEIIKWFFTFSDDAIKKPMKVIVNALIAGILIQASWFLLGAVIDISTIATYAIGGIPTTIFQETDFKVAWAGDKKIWELAILWSHVKFDFKNMKWDESYSVYYAYGEQEQISECQLHKGNYIVGRKGGGAAYALQNTFTEGNENYNEICVYNWWQIVIFKWIVDPPNDTDYSTILTKAIDDADEDKRTERQENGNVVYIGNDEEKLKLGGLWSTANAVQRWDRRVKDQKDAGGTTLGNIIGKTKWFSKVLITMYGSLLDFAHLSDVDFSGEKSIASVWLEVLIKTIFALALIIPLALMAVVLVARIGYLWLIIAFTPILILKRVFLKEGSWELYFLQ